MEKINSGFQTKKQNKNMSIPVTLHLHETVVKITGQLAHNIKILLMSITIMLIKRTEILCDVLQ